MIIFLKHNAKDIDGFLVPLYFFDGNIRLVEKRFKTSLIECKNKQLEVLNEYIIEKP